MLKAVSSLLILIVSVITLTIYKLGAATPPCSKPITYAIATFDRRFGISQKDFLSVLSEAKAIWERPLQDTNTTSPKELFAYNPEKSQLKINLIYDRRQQVTEVLGQIKGEVNESEETHHALEGDYLALREKYSKLKSSYDVQVAEFTASNEDYNKRLDNWNNGNRSDKGEFKALQAERASLEVKLSQLKNTESVLNDLASSVNEYVERLNNLARTLNLDVKQYNTIGASLGETFAGGTYTRDSSGARIDVFEFSNHDKLVRVLAHEFGHALGLEHLEDPKAIMYRLNQGEVSKLADSDLSALKALCKVN
ncbi:MAG: matrixin family metalloprotease [Patescibacteria group bacterium]